ncbi:ATP synthase subunit I [Candidatus Halobeggiatoa sp. HSG11]|nr:ATP synthase subunit I [Candidatus Halobeggiatoa sp. HSG11]
MNSDSKPLDTGASKILAVQAMTTTGIAWFFYFYQTQLAAQSALFGGFIVMFNVWMMNRRIRLAARVDKPGNEVRIFYIAAMQRFIFTLSFFVIGMGLLSFPPIPMLVAFAIAHLGYLAGQF